jgi:hypothetical protein
MNLTRSVTKLNIIEIEFRNESDTSVLWLRESRECDGASVLIGIEVGCCVERWREKRMKKKRIENWEGGGECEGCELKKALKKE